MKKIRQKTGLFLRELRVFIWKQAKCSIFGGLMLFYLIITNYVAIPGIHRYDLIFILAILTQIVLIVTKAEHIREVGVIIIFHICAMIMEIFKTSPAVGSWQYPDAAIFAIYSVPLFSGFMYSAVGSYMARAWRINKFVFQNMPRRLTLLLVAILIYFNFFANHYIYDFRLIIFAILIVVFWRTKFYVQLTEKVYTIHPLVSNLLLALFVWFGEQVGTSVRVWIYPNQVEHWAPVSFHMLTSWYLLLIMSFVIVSTVYLKRSRNEVHD